MSPVDLRSDFIARPTPAMVEAMTRAAELPCGFGPREDATVSRLETLAAAMLGKEDALFVPTCMMANQIAIHLHCRHGDVFVTESDSHVVTSESAAASALSGAMPRLVPASNGALDIDALAAALTPGDAQRARPAMVLMENTHVRSGGRPLPLDNMRQVSDQARMRGVGLHLDGARIFNASVALRCPVEEIAGHGDTVSFNLNKGLGAPMGAILAGRKEAIAEAVRIRQMFGGGWRPAGILAAAGIVALETMVDRIADDHANARRLAEGLSAMDGFLADPASTETNIVLAQPTQETPEAVAGELARHGVLVMPYGAQLRLVTHHEITAESVEQVLDAFRTVLTGESLGI
jgi:threonine aldolase